MIDANHTQLWLSLDLDWHRRLIKCGCHGVDRDRVVWICRVRRDVANDGQLAVRCIERGHVDEVGDLGGEINAVDEDIALNDL